MRYQSDSKQVYEYFSSVEQRTVEWLWYPYIPYGKITVLQGDPGEGKSTFILNVAALVTQGKALPDGYSSEGPQVVVYQCAEDNLADTIKPRLVAAGADCEKVVYIINQDEQLNLDDERIEQTIRETSARMCILDPLQSFLLQEGDMHSVVRMRNLLSKLGRIAAKYRCAIVLVSHLNKSTGGKMLYRSLGSIDIAAVARSVLMISRDEDEPKIRCLSQVKSSLAPCGATVRFSIGSDGAIEWVQDCEWKAVSKEMMLTDNKQMACENLLAAMLGHGPLGSIEVIRCFEQMGVSERTLYTAKKNLGVQSVRKNKAWYWSMPDMPEEEETDESEI